MKTPMHKCEGHFPHDGYGEAIDSCYANEVGEMWAGNGEYGSQVCYCPYCGEKARVQPVIEPTIEQVAESQRRKIMGEI
jgi:hypothetical protein